MRGARSHECFSFGTCDSSYDGIGDGDISTKAIATVDEHKRELVTEQQKLTEAKARLHREQAKVDDEKFALLADELDAALDALDTVGWTPAGEQRVTEILAGFRMAHRSGESAEALRVFVDRLNI